MIASLLPGLRDLRVPLATGFLWLVAVWLITYPLIPSEEESSGLIAEVYKLTDALGVGTLAASLTFIAFLVGIFQGQLGYLVRTLISTVRTRVETSRSLGALEGEDVLPPRRPGTDVRPARIALSLSSHEQAWRHAWQVLVAAERAGMERGGTNNDLFESDKPSLPSVVSPHYDMEWLYYRMAADVPLVATRLLATNKELFDRYDRADAEAKFRFGVAVPLAVVAFLIAVRLGLPWWGWLVFAVVLGIALTLIIWDGFNKRRESNDAVYQAVLVSEVEFPAIETIKSRIEEIKREEAAKPQRGSRKN